MNLFYIFHVTQIYFADLHFSKVHRHSFISLWRMVPGSVASNSKIRRLSYQWVSWCRIMRPPTEFLYSQWVTSSNVLKMFMWLCSRALNAWRTRPGILSVASPVWGHRVYECRPNDAFLFLFQSNDSWQGHDSDQVSSSTDYWNVPLKACPVVFVHNPVMLCVSER